MQMVFYYSGCTLKTTAANFEQTAIKVCEAIGLEFKELPVWNCCGTVYTLAKDDLVHLVAPARNLARASAQNIERIVVLCAMCYNTLMRTNLVFKDDLEKREKLTKFMDDEKEYDGRIKIEHFLQFISLESDKIKNAVKKQLNLNIAPYYGCLLLRPQEVAIDSPESPSLMNNVLAAIGCKTVETPYMTECCGSYNSVTSSAVISERVDLILKSARSYGADAVTVACPLCAFNLDFHQSADIKMPVLYFTQLLAIAVGVDLKDCRFQLHNINPTYLFANG